MKKEGRFRELAQLVERLAYIQKVGGSRPSFPTYLEVGRFVRYLNSRWEQMGLERKETKVADLKSYF